MPHGRAGGCFTVPMALSQLGVTHSLTGVSKPQDAYRGPAQLHRSESHLWHSGPPGAHTGSPGGPHQPHIPGKARDARFQIMISGMGQ